MEFIITRQSIINRCNADGKLHLIHAEAERPCSEAYLKPIKDIHGEECTRFFIDLESPTIETVNELGKKYGVDVLVTENLEFPGQVALVLYDEESTEH